MVTVLVAAAAAGGAFGGGAAGFVASTLAFSAAAIVDSQIAGKLLLKDEPSEPPRLNDLALSSTGLGSPRPRFYGNQLRFPGHLAWKTRNREVKTTQNGGKGGSGQAFVVYKSYAHCAWTIGRRLRGIPIKSIDRVYFDGNLFWSREPTINYASNKISARVEVINEGLPTAGDPYQQINTLVLTSNMAAGGPDLTKLASGKELLILGFTDTGHAFASGGINVAEASPSGDSCEMDATVSGEIYRGDEIKFDLEASTFVATRDRTFVGAGGGGPDVVVKLTPDINTGSPEFHNINNGDDVFFESRASVNNGVLEVLSTSFDVGSQTSTCRLIDPADPLRDFAGRAANVDTVTIFQELPQFSLSRAAACRSYLGSRDQSVDPIIQAIEELTYGAGNVLAHRTKPMFVVEDLDVTSSLRAPNAEFEITVGDGADVAAMIRGILLDDGWMDTEVDVGDVSSTAVDAYPVLGPQPTGEKLLPLLEASQVVPALRGKVVVFRDRSRLASWRADLPAGPCSSWALEAGEGEDDGRPRRLRITDAEQNDVPRRIWVKASSPDRAYQTLPVASTAIGDVEGEDRTVTLPLVMSDANQRALADVLLDQARRSGRRIGRWNEPFSFLLLALDGTIGEFFDVHRRNWKFIVTKIDEGANGVIECEGVEESSQAL